MQFLDRDDNEDNEDKFIYKLQGRMLKYQAFQYSLFTLVSKETERSFE